MSEVADFNHRSSPQPARVPVRARVAEILTTAGNEKSGLPVGFTHRELACAVYATDVPSAAQESAIRRAVAALVAAGQAERDVADRTLNRYDHAGGRHQRLSRDGEWLHSYSNPPGILVRRKMTAADREARAAVMESYGHVEYAARVRSGDVE